jgi:predicted MFS family arabinose efflux permease
VPLAVSQALYAVLIAVLAEAHSVPLIAAAYFGACGMMVAGGPIPRSYVGTAVRPRLRATGLALLATQWVVAEAIGSGAGGALIDKVPIDRVLLASAALPVVSAGLVLVLFRGQSRATSERAGERRVNPSRERADVVRILAVTAALALLVQIGIGGELALLPLLVTDQLQLPASAAGAAMLAVGLISGVLLVPGGGIADRWGRRPAMVAGGIAIAIGYVAYAAAGSFAVVIAGAVARAAGQALIWPAVTAWIAESMPRRRHAFYMGLFGEFENAGVTIGPVVGGVAWSLTGIQSAFAVYAVAAVVASVVAVFTVSGARRDVALESLTP